MSSKGTTTEQQLSDIADTIRDAAAKVNAIAREVAARSESRHVLRREVIQVAPPDAILLTTAAAATLIGVGEQTLRNWRAGGEGPPAVTRGKMVRYRREALEAWVDTEFK